MTSVIMLFIELLLDIVGLLTGKYLEAFIGKRYSAGLGNVGYYLVASSTL